MISFFFTLSLSFTQCDEIQADLSFNIVDNQTIESGKWLYYYSHHELNTDEIVVKLYSTNYNELQLAPGNGLQCPDSTNGAVTLANGAKSVSLTIKPNSELGIVNFGVYNSGSDPATFLISASGVNPNNYDSKTHTTFTGIFMALCILLLVLFFVHAILARDKVYYKVEVEE